MTLLAVLAALSSEYLPAGSVRQDIMRTLLVIAVFLAAAPTASAAPIRITLKPLPETSVGRVDGTRAFIAVSLRGDRLRAYVCDGTLRRDPTISTWFRTRWDRGGPLTLHRAGHTLRLTPGLRGRLDGHRFRTRPVDAPAGLFRGRHQRLRTTWIVLGNGHKRGTFVPTRPPKCRFVLVTGSNGQQQWVTVC
ncbi:MAG TPA: hypothetical protein VFX51_14545 [Solirubrobacteraceae bacterium]|nr:hypothetical protein [Solirubrobacteraceae bacterium]